MTRQHYSIEELAEVLERNEDQIIAEWRVKAQSLLEELSLDKSTLTDHVPNIITEIIQDLKKSGKLGVDKESDKDSPPAHGVQRFHDGLDVGEVVAEYNLLRTAFATVAERHEFNVAGEASRMINDRIDEGVRLAVIAFATQQELMRKKQEDEHLAFIAHDLRTPLNAVSLLVDELRYSLDEKTLADTGEVFEILERNLHRVELLIKQVLDTKTGPSGMGKFSHPEHRIFELRPVVQRLIRDLHAVSSKDGVEIIDEIPPSLTVYADACLITHVFQNLLTNAFKYARKGRVTICASNADESVICTVRDNGTGIPPEMLDKVFDKLATDPAKLGTGLGLAIVKQIMEAHGGSVKVESIYGEGAVFTFTLPLHVEN